MENYIIAIPSYKRAARQETLEYLRKLGTPKERIFIFVQTEEDLQAYTEAYSDDANIIFKEGGSVAEARNNILRHFDGQSNVLMMDDDISAIGLLKGEDLAPIKSREALSNAINKCYEVAAKANAPLFGLYPVYNAFFMSRTISTIVTVCAVLGFVKGYKILMDESYITKEDIELCARIISYGKRIYRFNFLAPKARCRTNKGGCHEVWKSRANEDAVKRLCIAYPKILAPHPKKPNEVRVIAKDRKINLTKKPKGGRLV